MLLGFGPVDDEINARQHGGECVAKPLELSAKIARVSLRLLRIAGDRDGHGVWLRDVETKADTIMGTGDQAIAGADEDVSAARPSRAVRRRVSAKSTCG